MITADLHCDILSLPTLTGTDISLRCTPDQLIRGQVGLQVCAMFAETTPKSIEELQKQNKVFLALPKQFSFFEPLGKENIHSLGEQTSFNNRILIIRAIENASGIATEKESMKNVIARLETILAQGPLAYVSLVWNFANRFGGGALEPKALTPDGKILLQELDRLAIPVDLSHASAKLAEDVLDYGANKLPTLMTVASHSNFLSVHNHPRNLRDDHAKEIAYRGGVIGLCVVKDFVGKSFDTLTKHIQKAIDLGIVQNLCMGADFFHSSPQENKFFPQCQNASDYKMIRKLIADTIPDKKEQEGIIYHNAKTFLQKLFWKKCPL
ncbi:dipeptidase [Chlamydiifrater phoenicopteri]|uniref:dipeptidase n=1 Tax=Chlamydiifrater phoenicopteri TaxID=2681469 RepID=UPI001BCC3B2A|nr:membrane dipeptidase [Chlamydiifrater phoenicopteri]